MLNRVNDALKEIDNNVFYGGVSGVEREDKWDYIVFSRGALKRSAKGNTSYTHTINVVIVREEYVPEETIYQVIEAMEHIPGVRLAENGVDFEYDRKPSTKTIIEMAMLSFSWARKKVGAR